MTIGVSRAGNPSLSVLHLVAHLRTGGVRRFVTEAAKGGPGFGVTVSVAVLTGSASKPADWTPDPQVAVTYLGHQGVHTTARTVRQVVRLAQEQGADVIQTHGALDRIVGAYVAQRLRIPMVATVHWSSDPGDPARWKTRAWKTARTIAESRAAHFVAVSRSVANHLVNERAVDRSKVSVIYPGLDATRLEALDPDRPGGPGTATAVRREIGVDRSVPLLMNIGRLAYEKGQRVLVKMMTRVPPPTVLAIVGDGLERSELEQEANRLGVGDRIRFLGERDDVDRLLAAATIGVFSSITEGLGIALLEAMAAARPVVVSPIAAFEEVVTHGVNGMISRHLDPAAFADIVNNLLRDPHLRWRLGLAARRRATEFTSERMNRELAELYRSLGGVPDESGGRLMPKPRGRVERSVQGGSQ